jgi:pilus assembly protein CpaB
MLYETRKNLWLIAIALVFAAIAAALATRWMQSRVATVDSTGTGLANAVVAARDVPMGKRIEVADLKIVRAASDGVPADAYRDIAAVVGQVSRSPFVSGEMLIARRLSKYSGGSALAAVVARDMRAVTVRVDDVIGVGGFILPENRVDVIAAFNDGTSPQASTIVRDVRVLAVDQRSDPGSDGPILSRAVTLEVTPKDAEAIAASKQRGSIQLALRNPMNRALADSLDTEEIQSRTPLVIAAGMPTITVRGTSSNSAATKPPKPVVTLIRGTSVTQRVVD